jgi:hypothetical protein
VIPILLAPGLLIVSGWGVMAPNGISFLTSVAAAFIIRRTHRLINFPVVLLLTISFLSYPPGTAIFLSMPCLAWILSTSSLAISADQKQLIRTINNSIKNIMVAGIISLVVIKIFASQYLQTNNRTQLIGDFPTKVRFMYKTAIPTAFDYFEPKWGFSYYGWFTVIMVLSLFMIVKCKNEKMKFLYVMAVGIGGTFAPVMLTAENWPSNRSLLASQWMLATLTVMAIFQIIDSLKRLPNRRLIIKISGVALLILSIYHSNNLLLSTMKNPQLQELNLARKAVSGIDPTIQVDLTKSEWTDSLAPWVAADEFGIPSTCQPWIPIPLVKLILKESHPSIIPKIVLVDQLESRNSIDFSKLLNTKNN